MIDRIGSESNAGDLQGPRADAGWRLCEREHGLVSVS